MGCSRCPWAGVLARDAQGYEPQHYTCGDQPWVPCHDRLRYVYEINLRLAYASILSGSTWPRHSGFRKSGSEIPRQRAALRLFPPPPAERLKLDREEKRLLLRARGRRLHTARRFWPS